MTTLNENDEHCHQRPEKCSDRWLDCSHNPNCHQRPECQPHNYVETLSDVCACGDGRNAHCHQRPESDWEKEFDLLIRETTIFKLENWATKNENDIKSFIARQRDSEYQRGKDTGWCEHEQEWKNELEEEYQRGQEDGYKRGLAEWYKDEEYQRGLAEGASQERQFILNVLDGIDIANEHMGLPHDTKAIRCALESRILPTPPHKSV